MKTSYLIPCIIAISLVTSCIKEEGEELTILRTVGDSTMLSNEDGYFYGEAEKDKCIGNYDTIVIAEQGIKKIQKVDCYMNVEAKYYNLSPTYYSANSAQDTIVKCGFAYSRKNQKPIIGQEDTKVEYAQSFKNLSGDSIKFNVEIHNLDFNAKYFIRSFVINQKKDTCYNAHVLDTTTTLPGNVWFQRKDATLATGIEMPICFTIEEEGPCQGTYIYGGRDDFKCYNDLWKYSEEDDSWEQKASFENDIYKPYRCNGAAFVTKLRKSYNDYLIYICGGENAEGVPLAQVFTYNPQGNRYNNQDDHPNGRAYVQELPQALTGLVAFELKNQGGGDQNQIYYVGLGSTATDITKPYNRSVNSIIYKYDVQYDKFFKRERTEDMDTALLTWKNAGSLTGNNNTIGEALSNPVFLKVNETSFYIGTGNSTRTKDYTNVEGITTKTNLSNTFYYFTNNNEGTLVLNSNRTITAPAEFVPRTNAAGFFISYNKGERNYNRLYVGTGIDDNNVLKDFWAYDMSDQKWIRCSDCSIEKYRYGAVGFVVERTDDEYYNTLGTNKRGIIAFGRGFGSDGTPTLFKDVWEYLP